MKDAAGTETTKCLRCGRPLRSAKSVASGYGPTCTRKVKAAAKAKVVAEFKPAQVAKAEELIEQGGIVAIRGRRIFAVVASNGAGTYKTAPQGCTCPAGLKGKFTCYHRIAATILTAA